MAKGGEGRILKAKGIEGNGSFRNRQVASSTLALGSTFSFVSIALRISLNPLFP
jgi:hypothetical protein